MAATQSSERLLCEQRLLCEPSVGVFANGAPSNSYHCPKNVTMLSPADKFAMEKKGSFIY